MRYTHESFGLVKQDEIEALFTTIKDVLRVTKEELKSKNRISYIVDAKKIFSIICTDVIKVRNQVVSYHLETQHSDITHNVKMAREYIKNRIEFNYKFTEVRKEYIKKQQLILEI